VVRLYQFLHKLQDMKNIAIIIVVLSLLIGCKNQQPNGSPTRYNSVSVKKLGLKRVKLTNGWALTPIGKSLKLQDLPLNLVVSPSKKYLAVTNNGQSTQSITLIDASTETILDDEPIEKSWLGLAFSPDEKFLYASAGNDNKINIYKIENNQLQKNGEIILDKPWPVKVSPAGLCATEQHIFVVAKENNSLYQLDIASKSILKKIPLAAEAYTCILSPDKNLLYISLWGGAKILIYDISASKIIDEIAVDKNPNDMVLTKDGQYLYVSHGNDNTVSIIDTKQKQRIETLSCSLYPDSPIGSTPNGVE
jgi:YVTN family beta-propeller protein